MVDREIDVHLPGPARPAAHRGLGDALLRVQRGRRRPDRQRLVERRARSRDLLAEAGVQPGADAVLQTSQDGWTCGTPLAALTDDRNAMLAIAMNGEPLPVRARLPGADGRARALRLRLGDQVAGRPRGDPRSPTSRAYWTDRGWSEKGPVKTESRIDVPRDGATVSAGHGAGRRAAPGRSTPASRRWSSARRRRRGRRPSSAGCPAIDTWVQWAGTVDVAPGEHHARRCGPPTGPATRRPRRAPTWCPTARPAGTA